MRILQILAICSLLVPSAETSELRKITQFSARQQSAFLLYNRLGSVVVLVANGTVQHLALHSGTALTSKPALSPDRSMIAYTATTGFLMTQNLKTGEIQQIKDGIGYDPTWSPDGKYLASAYRQKLFITDVTSSKQRT